MDTCQFRPNQLGEVCGNPASRQVFFPDPPGKGYYLYICDDCLPQATEYWKENNFEVEF